MIINCATALRPLLAAPKFSQPAHVSCEMRCSKLAITSIIANTESARYANKWATVCGRRFKLHTLRTHEDEMDSGLRRRERDVIRRMPEIELRLVTNLWHLLILSGNFLNVLS